MKILFSPSEAKTKFTDASQISSKSFVFPQLFDKRVNLVKKLELFLQDCDPKNLEKFFGIKNTQECKELAKLNLLEASTCKALQRYTGVAYNYLDFETLSDTKKSWIFENTLIFSNLFGPLGAGDEIPYYRFKQGSTIDGFKPELFYKENFTKEIDNYIGSDLVVDLRAGFYEKFYKLTCKHITCKFIKNGKVVSHWAKAYRGKMLRELSKYRPNTKEEFENINFTGLSTDAIIEKKLKIEYIFKIDV
jgi:cytoplasmic iron level regulating protein YaaA (DUF328/UPF0246 family)